jgi:UDP-glucose 4-epimerase
MGMGSRSVLVTGGAGYIGRLLVSELAADRRELESIVSFDLRPTPDSDRLSGVAYVAGDIRTTDLADLLHEHRVDTVVHLAAIVTPSAEQSRELMYEVDVGGTQKVVTACLAGDAHRLIVTSSGAAYGYYHDNPQPLHEDDALRGNPEFAYSDHKRIVEELLGRARDAHPELEQLVFRVGTILGESTRNQITDIFDRPRILGVMGSDTPFVFIWDRDVVACLARGVHEGGQGVYNLTGGGVLTLAEIAGIVGKPYLALPAPLIRGALGLLHPLGLSQYGPEQVDFLRYRPVLANEKLVKEFGFRPRKSTREVFEFFWQSRREESG